MCGLACAVGLRRAGIDVTVFEAAPKFDEIGAGVGLGSNALRALQGLGVLEAVLAKVNQTPTQRLFAFISGTGDHEQIYDYAEHFPKNLGTGLGIYRPVFLDALMPLLDSNVAKFNKRCVSVGRADSGRQVMHFADNTTYEADLVIGADGIKSITRDAVVSDSRLGFSNTYAYRGLIPIDALKLAGVKTDVQSRPYCWVGLGNHIITFPIKDQTVLNVVAFVREKETSMSPARPSPWVEVVPQQEVIDGYPGWGNDAKIIFQHLEQPSRWSIHTLYPPLETFVNGKIVLVGDAAHGMLPHLGAGAGQGFEDVYTLCRLLSHPTTTKSNLDAVIKVYDTIRCPRANMVLERSIRMGVIVSSFGPNHYSAEDIRRHLRGMLEPVWLHDLEAEVTGAIEAMGQT
ncbi:salicylate hydroxylase [Phlegmacium glaucopus]|nr:salicylate hydroxylase [Phlegmacium glaucopus]